MVDYITLMAKKSKSDWMLQKWADANGYLDDPEPSVNVKTEEEGIGGWTFDCPKCGGTGMKGDALCERCDGTGEVYESGKHYEDEGRWDKSSAITRDISCPLCNEIQKSLYSSDTPQPDLEREYGEHLSKQHGLKPEAVGQTEPCELCGDPNGHWIPGGIFLCDACDKATKPEEDYPEDKVKINYTQELNPPSSKKPPVETDEWTPEMQAFLDSLGKEEAGKDYAGTCPRCDSDNTKKTKSQAGGTIGLCNDCGETWKLKEAPQPDQKGGEIPLGKAGDVSKVSKPLQPERSLTRESPKGETSSCPECNCPECGLPPEYCQCKKPTKDEIFGLGKPKEKYPFQHECPYGCGWKYTSETTPQEFQTHLKQTHPEDFQKIQPQKQPKQPTQPAVAPTTTPAPTQPPNDWIRNGPDVEHLGLAEAKEPDPSNPDKELNPDPELPPPVDATTPDSDIHDTNDKSGDDSQIHMKPQTYSADGVELPDKIEIPERLFNDLMMMIEYSTTNDNEAGGFLIIAEHGNLGVVGEQFGKDREIVLEPNEQLHEGEQLIGTVHMHPVTPTASTGDVTGYLNDENEKVMVVVGADKSINFFFKIPGMTNEGDYGDEISDNFEQEDMGMMAEGFGFIWYRGEESDRTELHLMDNIIEDLEFDVLDESWPVEDVVKALGIKGRPDIPEEYSTKKTPLRLQVPFSYCTEYKTLKG